MSPVEGPSGSPRQARQARRRARSAPGRAAREAPALPRRASPRRACRTRALRRSRGRTLRRRPSAGRRDRRRGTKASKLFVGNTRPTRSTRVREAEPIAKVRIAPASGRCPRRRREDRARRREARVASSRFSSPIRGSRPTHGEDEPRTCLDRQDRARALSRPSGVNRSVSTAARDDHGADAAAGASSRRRAPAAELERTITGAAARARVASSGADGARRRRQRASLGPSRASPRRKRASFAASAWNT